MSKTPRAYGHGLTVDREEGLSNSKMCFRYGREEQGNFSMHTKVINLVWGEEAFSPETEI